MQHTLAAVFDNQTSAQQAMNELIRCGFPTNDLKLTDASTASGATEVVPPATGERDEPFGKAVMHFFSDLFGAHHGDTHVYTEAINRGNCVLTFVTDDQDKVERAADIIEGYGPIDIDEYESQWRASGWTGAETLRSTGYQTAGASMQSGGAGSSSGTQSGASSSGTPAAGTATTAFSWTASTQGTTGAGSQQRDTTTGAPDVRVGERTGQTGGVRVYSRLDQNQQGPFGADEDSYYRAHYSSQMAALGGSYTDYEPAYRYGASMAGSPDYTGAKWDEVESRLRTNWETGHPGSAWERFKAAVRHGWERVTSSTDDDDEYRNHWLANYGSSSTSSSYDEYAPAYRYGSSMATSDTYRGRKWEDIEPTLRSDWESRYPDSAWDRFKAAVRHGWDRITSSVDNDDEYRSHWNTNYGGQGGTYDEYAPAYRYGSSMRSSSTYRGRSWDDVEPTLRSDWETRYPGSAWDRFKAAVRHGWDRITS